MGLLKEIREIIDSEKVNVDLSGVKFVPITADNIGEEWDKLFENFPDRKSEPLVLPKKYIKGFRKKYGQ